MKTLQALTLICVATTTTAHAAEPDDMIAQCDAPIATALDRAVEIDAETGEWNHLNLAIKAHRTGCSLAMALTCHHSDAPDACFSGLVTAIDARAEVESRKLVAFAEEGGVISGYEESTAEDRAAERETVCARTTSDAGVAISGLGGDTVAACRVEVSLTQWADLWFIGGLARMPAFQSLLPPKR